MTIIEILTNLLQGKHLTQFSVSDTWHLCFENHWLIAQNVSSEDEDFLNTWLKNNYSPYQDSIDQKDISKSAIIAAHMRKRVVELKLDKDSKLIIEFENNSRIIIPTNIEIVDWQWCINKSGNDPYNDYLIACFEKGNIMVKDNQVMN